MATKRSKAERHQKLLEQLQQNPFLTDEELARSLGVSIHTIRLDRMELDIAELRERLKSLLANFLESEQFIQGYRLLGEILEVEPGQRVLSLLVITAEMVVPRTQVVRPYYLVAQAHAAALRLFPRDEEVFTADANVKFLRPVKVGERLVADARVAGVRGDRYCIKVTTRSQQEQVFRATFHIYATFQEGEER